jgi:MFS family permease
MSNPTPTSPPSADLERAPFAAWWTLAVLIALAIYTIADRPMINLLVEPIRKDLSLSDFQVGLVQGVSVALFTLLVGYPIAWLADRFDRRLVLAISITVWFVGLGCAGLARSFEELFFASAMVGAGEAALVPIALAMIPELFNGRRRHLANSLLLVGARLGVGLVIAACGWSIAAVDTLRPLLPDTVAGLATWRLALISIALPGVVLVLLILTLRVPRNSARHESPAAPAPAARPAWSFLSRHRLAFASFYGGVALQAFAISCVMNFAPATAIRQMGATPVEAGNGMGSATFVATVVGFLFAQAGYRWLSPRVGPRLPALALLGTSICGILVTTGLLFASTTTQLFVATALFLCVIMAGTLLFPTALQDITPSPMRARLASISITLNIVISGLAPSVVGAVSDQLKGRPDGLQLAMVSVAIFGLVASMALMWPLVSRYLTLVTAARAEETT